MNFNIFFLILFVDAVVGNYTCSSNDCHECIGDTCNLSCQGESCRDCPSGDCCDGSNCNVCVASSCCTTAKCNRCVKKQRKSCSEESADCNSIIAKKCELSYEEQDSVQENLNAGHHNITTIIRIHNLINNTNLVETPIELNITNVNDMLLNKTGGIFKTLERRKGCCFVVHPEDCHKIQSLPKEICFTRRHNECSELCGNSTNVVIRTSSTKQCVTIAVHPYYYCGYYTAEDCSACYNCTEGSKIECMEQPTCSKICRASILPRKYYNVPYYKKTSEEPPAE